jgi:hypothetical protein
MLSILAEIDGKQIGRLADRVREARDASRPRSSSARDACASQHAPEIDEHLHVDVLAMRRVESLHLAAERYAQPAVALLLHGPSGFEQ